MSSAIYRTDHIRLTDMQITIMQVLQEKYITYAKPYDGTFASELLDIVARPTTVKDNGKVHKRFR